MLRFNADVPSFSAYIVADIDDVAVIARERHTQPLEIPSKDIIENIKGPCESVRPTAAHADNVESAIVWSLQAGAALAGEALSLNRGRRWRAAPEGQAAYRERNADAMRGSGSISA